MALTPYCAKSQLLRFRRNIASSLQAKFHDENPLLLQFFCGGSEPSANEITICEDLLSRKHNHH